MSDNTAAENSEAQKHQKQNILETVSFSHQNQSLQNFNPQQTIFDFLEKLKDREKEILTARFGLISGETETLENIGKKLQLTRERVRQIEKDAMKKLGKVAYPQELEQGQEVIYQIIEEYGNVIREDILTQKLVPYHSKTAVQSIIFLLSLSPRFSLLKENDEYYRSWHTLGFDQETMDKTINRVIEFFKQDPRAMNKESLFAKIREANGADLANLPDLVLESYISISRKIGKNPFGEYGLTNWAMINPKDVGDKGYLVLQHHRKPEHYSKITELINQEKFDDRQAHKETVHNELIKDPRFVLIGRGIYALKEWGYSRGTVADVIIEILQKENRSLTKNEIIERVLKKRMVKKNTIIVALSNKSKFKKNEENKYVLAQ